MCENSWVTRVWATACTVQKIKGICMDQRASLEKKLLFDFFFCPFFAYAKTTAADMISFNIWYLINYILQISFNKNIQLFLIQLQYIWNTILPSHCNLHKLNVLLSHKNQLNAFIRCCTLLAEWLPPTQCSLHPLRPVTPEVSAHHGQRWPGNSA